MTSYAPYWTDGTISIFHGDAREIAPQLPGIVVTDPPFNIGYHYRMGGDRLHADAYRALLTETLRLPSVVIHYPEQMFLVADILGVPPERCVSWVYPSNTRRQHRQIAWFGVKPDFTQVRQPYKNPTDRRVRALIAGGSQGAALYDWWEVNQVKNVSAEKVSHPCQMPLEVMRRVVALTPSDAGPIVDPFMGGATTLAAAQMLGRPAAGIEIDERYCEIAARRLSEAPGLTSPKLPT